MADPTPITYLFDPLCGWCYGASPVLERLCSFGDLRVDLVPTGLFADDGARPLDESFAAYAWANDQRIAELTGQAFSEFYRSGVLGDHTRLLDSGPATLALTAVALSDPSRELAALKAIQRARYLGGCDNTDLAVLAGVLNGVGLSEAAGRLLAPDDTLRAVYRRRVEDGKAKMRLFGIDGVPALVVGNGGEQRVVRTSVLFAGMHTLLASLRAA